MKAITVFENIEAQHNFYVVEKIEHTLSINNKPILKFDYDFFVNKADAKELQKKLKTSFNTKSPYNKCRVFSADKNLFKWFEISPRKAIYNGVEHNYYYFTGGLNKIHPNTGENIRIDIDLDVFNGKIISNILNLK